MATTEKHILYRIYGVAAFIFILAIAVGVKLLNIQIVDGEKYKEIAEERTYRNFVIPANRGNLYDTNGNLLATSVPEYDIRFDAVTVSDKNFEENIIPLSDELSKMFGKVSSQYGLKNCALQGLIRHSYLLIASNLGYSAVYQGEKFSNV